MHSMIASRSATARLAGFLYLFVMGSFMAGLFAMARFAAAEGPYRVALLGPLLSALATVPLAAAFHALLKPAGAGVSTCALLFRTVEAALGGVTVLLLAVALKEAAQASFHAGIVFFAPGSMLFFVLMWRTRLVPRLLAGWGVLASVLAGLLGLAFFAAPGLVRQIGVFGWAPIFVAEIGTGLWLLLRGAGPESAR